MNLTVSHYLAVIIMALWCSSAMHGQNDRFAEKQISFRELNVEDGLSQNSVISIAQDSVGYLWLATQDGLNKYDGKDFLHYNYQFEDVTRNDYSRLGKVYVDREGSLWIIPKKGGPKKKKKSEDYFKEVKGLSNVSTLFQAKDKTLYAGTYGNGIYAIPSATPDTIQLLKKTERILDVYDITETADALLFATSSGLYRLDKDTPLDKPALSKIQEGKFSVLASSRNGRVFIGTFGNGLFQFHTIDGKVNQFNGFDTSEMLPKTLNILDLLFDSKGRLWVATYGSGAYMIDFSRESIKHFTAKKTDPYALHYNDILTLFEDFNENIWLGTDGAGVSFYDAHLVKFNVLTNYQTPPKINVDVIRAISVADNTMWLGTSGKGLTKIEMDTAEYNTYDTENSDLAGDRIMSLLFDKKTKTLWIGLQNHGLQKMDSQGEIIEVPILMEQTIWNIYKADSQTLWLCTRNNGILVFDTKRNAIIKQYAVHNSALTTNNIRTIAKGADATIWIGTDDKGVFSLNTVTDSITQKPLLSDPVKSLFFDSEKKALFVGTNGSGLLIYTAHNNAIYRFTRENGLSNNVIYGVLPGELNSYWLSSNQGLTKIELDSQYQAQIENYSNYDGLQALEFNTGAYFKDSNGTLYFGGLEGINWFTPRQLSFNKVPPKTVVTGLEVFNKPIPLEQGTTFNYDENTVTFLFASLHYSQPERNQYKYRMLPHDDIWIESGNTARAHYTNLPPDSYEFQVTSSNYDGVWNDRPTTFNFTIAKPWYTTHSAIAGYILLGLLALYAIYRYLKWRWYVQHQLKLEHQEALRLKKLDEFKTSLYTNISHEIRTPLTLIAGPLEHLLQNAKLKKREKKELLLVQQNSDRLMRLVQQMLDLSLVDAGELKLKVERGNLNILLKQIIDAFSYTAEQKQISVKSNIQGGQEVWFDKDVIEKILSNLLSNAIKYAPENSEILVMATITNAIATVKITNKKGLKAPTDFDKVFERFYQEDKAAEGIGVGLALVKELIALHKGNITVIENDESTITFQVLLPIHYNEFEEAVLMEDKVKPISPHTCVKKGKNRQKQSILVIEDDAEIRDYLKSHLSEEYEIVLAENGEKGLQIAVQKLPDLLISDIAMPGLSGIEVSKRIKENELTSHIPIILLTAKATEEDEIKGLQTGADVYITKPFSLTKLKIQVDNVITSRTKLRIHYENTFQLNPELALTSTETVFLTRLQEVLNENITNPELSSQQLADFMGMSRTHLHRKLTSIVGMSSTAFIRSQRIKLACELLEKTDANISEIAYEVGFNSISYFNKCFKELKGYTPKEYVARKT